jgi:hypothetical protein
MKLLSESLLELRIFFSTLVLTAGWTGEIESGAPGYPARGICRTRGEIVGSRAANHHLVHQQLPVMAARAGQWTHKKD